MNQVQPAKKDIELATPDKGLIQTCMQLPPRDLVEVKAKIKAVSCETGEMAKNCIYCKPVGKSKNPQTGQYDGAMQFAIGPSIRLTEIAHQNFGFMWLNGGIVDDSRDSITTKTMCFDLKTCNITFAMDTSPVKSYKQADVMRDRSLALSRRDALMQQVRPQLDAIMEDIKQRIISDCKIKGDDGVEKSAQANLKDLGASMDDIAAITRSQKNRTDKIVTMIGVANAINDGALEFEKVFGHPPIKVTSNGNAQSSQTPKQQYNTLILQLETKGGQALISDAHEQINLEMKDKKIKEWTDKDYEKACSVLKKFTL